MSFSLEMWKKSSIRKTFKTSPNERRGWKEWFRQTTTGLTFNQTQIESKAEKIKNLITQNDWKSSSRKFKIRAWKWKNREFEKFNSGFIVKTEA